MRTPKLRDRIRYRFDSTLSKGTPALVGWLFVVSASLVVVGAAVVVLFNLAPPGDDGKRPGFASLAWTTLMRTLDTGNLAGDTGGTAYISVMFALTIAGILIVSILIGLLTSGIEGRIEELRKGRSLVCEEDHTLILGWSPEIVWIVSELVLANANRPRSAIVILADKDKVEMEDELRARVGSPKHTRIVCRTGDPIDPVDLAIANPNASRSIILLAPAAEDPDTQIIKMILALTNNPERRQAPYHIVAELRDRKNLAAAELVGRGEAKLLMVSDLIASITVQTCRQSGLSVVYGELLSFQGNEMYVVPEPRLSGVAFGDALSMFETACLVGIKKSDGRVLLNPPSETAFESGDAAIAVADDDSSVRVSGKPTPKLDDDALRTRPDRKPAAEKTLVLGWNRRGATMLRELDQYVAPGSKVVVVASSAAAREDLAQMGDSANLAVEVQLADSTDRTVLDALDVPSFDHVITLAYSDEISLQQCDARTLISLLHLRDIAAKTGANYTVVSEMLDVKNRQLAEVTRADDFIVSDSLVSLLLSQVSESPDLAAVFAELFEPEGNELYLKPASDFVEVGRPVDFYAVVESARRQREVAIGYRLHRDATDAAKGYGVHVNPDKSVPVTFADRDRVIVVAYD